MSTNPRCKQRPKWPQFELETLRYQSAETTAYLVLVHYLQPHTELIDRLIRVDLSLGLFSFTFTTRLILSAFGQRSSKVLGWAGSMGPGFFYVYMANQRARASSDWHFAGNGNDFTILLSSVLFHFASECLLALVLWRVSACCFGAVPPTAGRIRITSNSNVNQCPPLPRLQLLPCLQHTNFSV
jgi:hypothetical protein